MSVQIEPDKVYKNGQSKDKTVQIKITMYYIQGVPQEAVGMNLSQETGYAATLRHSKQYKVNLYYNLYNTAKSMNLGKMNNELRKISWK